MVRVEGGLTVPQIIEGGERPRKGNTASLSVLSSCKSAFRDASAKDIAGCNEEQDKCIKPQEEETAYIVRCEKVHKKTEEVIRFIKAKFCRLMTN